ncbi:MAG: FAD-dependent thymidylate synthase, partial [Kiritimatiellia bacterium]
MKAEYIDHMGDDLRVVNAARVSFAKESQLVEDPRNPDFPNTLSERDTRLIHYLARHGHWTPFTHTSITLRMTAPVPVRTQCFKHKVGFTENEESRRYISCRPVLFMPEYFREKPEGSMKQGSGGRHPHSDIWLAAYRMQCEGAITLYECMVANGICPEQARFVLPQGVEVNWYWTGNIAAFARFYNQRTDPNAQKETRDL